MVHFKVYDVSEREVLCLFVMISCEPLTVDV